MEKSKPVGQKPPLRPKDVCAIRIHLRNALAVRDLALFNLAIERKLRGCDRVRLRVRDVTHVNQVAARAQVVERKNLRPVQFVLTEPTRSAVRAWLDKAALRSEQYLCPSRLSASPHLSTLQDARMIGRWVGAAGLDPTVYGTLESTIRYLGIEVDDALEISEQTEL
ncbi:site-specific integrase [Paraburkholderia diazotrophica]|nr:integrase [Paraburkholderia diazotrophica]